MTAPTCRREQSALLATALAISKPYSFQSGLSTSSISVPTVNISGAILWSVEVTGAVVGLGLVARHVDYSHVVFVSGSTHGLRYDVVQVDVILEQLPLSDLQLADRTAVPLLEPQSHAKR